MAPQGEGAVQAFPQQQAERARLGTLRGGVSAIPGQHVRQRPRAGDQARERRIDPVARMGEDHGVGRRQRRGQAGGVRAA